jgi:hypothetical protein
MMGAAPSDMAAKPWRHGRLSQDKVDRRLPFPHALARCSKQIGDSRRWVMCAEGLSVDFSGHLFAMS